MARHKDFDRQKLVVFFFRRPKGLDVHDVSVTDPRCRRVNPLITRSRNLSTGNTLYFSSKDK